MWALAFHWFLWFGLKAFSSRFLFTAHYAMREREQTLPSPWPLFRTDDLSSQHNRQTHHFALAVPDEETQLAWREKLVNVGLRVTPVLDRVYFKSIYTNDPDGHIVELATVGPGFTVDEDVADLGRSLKLPPWLEMSRSEIEQVLRPISAPEWRGL
jgi:catechol 2,3-dioxygenase-like lactoylglutathione lyase family enzyme